MSRKKSRRSDRVSADAEPPAVASKIWLHHEFATLLLMICGAALLFRSAMLLEYWRHNPIAQTPIIDGAFYWELAGRYAAGDLIGETPYLSAPLYPYVIGAIRAMGGGLLVVYSVQILMHLGTALILACIARRRFGEAVGLAAAIVFLLMDDAANGCFRILSDSLQLFLIVLWWAAAIRAQEAEKPRLWGIAGFTLGLACLTNASLILFIPPFVAWAALCTNNRRGWTMRAAPALTLCLLTISPASMHNYHVCGEFIPISAHSGIALRHGNAPGAQGVYTAAPGVSIDQGRQHVDAFRIYREKTGRDGTWRNVDGWFRGLAIDFWKADPLHAIELAIRKAYWFLTSVHYGDIHVPSIEAATGMDRLWLLAPIATAWLIPFSIFCLALAVKQWRTYVPDWIMLLVPLLTVMVFWYSPRYRLPVVPCVATTAACLMVRCFANGVFRRFRIAAGCAMVVALTLQVLNHITGFDDLQGVRASFHNNLAELYTRTQAPALALEQYRQTLRFAPDDPIANGFVGVALMRDGNLTEAVTLLECAVRAAPGDDGAIASLATAFARQNRFDDAVACFDRALRINPENEFAHANLAGALIGLNRPDEAATHYREVLRLNPDSWNAWIQLGRIEAATGDRQRAMDILQQGIEQAMRKNRDDVVRQFQEQHRRISEEDPAP